MTNEGLPLSPMVAECVQHLKHEVDRTAGVLDYWRRQVASDDPQRRTAEESFARACRLYADARMVMSVATPARVTWQGQRAVISRDAATMPHDSGDVDGAWPVCPGCGKQAPTVPCADCVENGRTITIAPANQAAAR